MPGYRIYLLDEVGSLISTSEYECADDAAAATVAATLMPQRAQAEVWRGAKFIGLIAAAAGLDQSAHP